MNALAQRLKIALERGAAAGPILLTGDAHDLETGEARAAAVLMAVTDQPSPGLILTKRTESLRRHAGQIAFPGGSLDPGETPVEAALREAYEEVGLATTIPIVVGEADRYRTVTGFEITPIVAVVPAGLDYVASPAEVDEVFEAPLDFVLDDANHVEASVEWQGRERRYYEIVWGRQRIWGATAAMIVNLARRLRWMS